MSLPLPSLDVIGNPDNYNSAKHTMYPYKDASITISIPNVTRRHTVKTKFRQKTPIYQNEQFRDAPDGIYLYIVSDKGFFANQVRSYAELGTVHRILATDSGSSKVYFAGEIRKTGIHITYNLFSGTYTLVILKHNPQMEDLEERMKTNAERILREFGLNPAFLNVPYITPDTLQLTDQELELYANMGYEIRQYDTEGYCSKADTTKLQQRLAQHMRTLQVVQRLNASKPHTELRANIDRLQGQLQRARECEERSSILQFSTKRNSRNRNRNRSRSRNRNHKRSRKHRA